MGQNLCPGTMQSHHTTNAAPTAPLPPFRIIKQSSPRFQYFVVTHTSRWAKICARAQCNRITPRTPLLQRRCTIPYNQTIASPRFQYFVVTHTSRWAKICARAQCRRITPRTSLQQRLYAPSRAAPHQNNRPSHKSLKGTMPPFHPRKTGAPRRNQLEGTNKTTSNKKRDKPSFTLGCQRFYENPEAKHSR
jgi:hypothetical protein